MENSRIRDLRDLGEFVFFDEATEIDTDLWKVLEGMNMAGDVHLVAISCMENPDPITGNENA